MSNKNTSYTAQLESCIQYIAFLEGLRERDDGRAVMAILRRNVGRNPDEAYEVQRYLARWLTVEMPRYIWLRRTRFLIATLFALHPSNNEKDISLGETLTQLCKAAEMSPNAVERRFNQLLAADEDDILRHLEYTVRLLESKDIPISWSKLMLDILRWNSPVAADRVRTEWAFDFWSIVEDAPQSES